MTAMEITVPLDLWESDDEAVITVWFAKGGAAVSAGDLLAEIMVVKTQHEIRAPIDGVLTIVHDTDAVVSKGAVIARIAT